MTEWIHTDCPMCPECEAPCGTTEDAGGPGLLRCGACGHGWQASAAEVAKADRADRAYAKMRAREDADARTYDRMPASVREANRRLLARAPEPAPEAEQLSLLGARS